MGILALSNLKDHLGITDSTQDDALTAIVGFTNTFVENYCHRKFESTEYVELYDGPGSISLVLNNYPIIVITEILVNGDEVTERADVNEEGYYIIDEGEGIIRNNDMWPGGLGNIQVTYTAGYESTDVPDDLFYAHLKIAEFAVNSHQSAGISNESLGGYSLSTMNSVGPKLIIPDIIIENILARYKNNILGRSW